MPWPGRRVDLLEAFLKRAESRLEKSKQHVTELEGELKAAREAVGDWEKGLAAGREKLTALKAELLGEDDVPDQQKSTPAAPAVAELHSQLAAIRAERDAFASAAAAEARAVASLKPLGVQELQTRLERCINDHTHALTESRWDAASSLADTMRKLTAALRSAHEAAAQERSVFNQNS